MSKFDTHGGYFAPKDYLKVNEGGSHEENPNGGVQIGVDPEGTPNLLEEGEPVYKDYVYSDNISAEREFLEQNNLPGKYEGKLYSKIADDILTEAEERPLDPISRNGLEALLGRLADAQEGQKQAKEQRDLEDELANLSPEELDQLEAMLAQEQPIGTDNPMYGEGPVGAQGEPGIPPEQMMGPAEPMPVEGIPMMANGGPLGKLDPFLKKRFPDEPSMQQQFEYTLLKDMVPEMPDFYPYDFKTRVKAQRAINDEISRQKFVERMRKREDVEKKIIDKLDEFDDKYLGNRFIREYERGPRVGEKKFGIFANGGPKKTMAEEIASEILARADARDRLMKGASGVDNTDFPLVTEHPDLDLALAIAQPGSVLTKAMAPSVYKGMINGISNGEPAYMFFSPMAKITGAKSALTAADISNMKWKIADYGKEITSAEAELASLKKELELIKKGGPGSRDVIKSGIEKANERIRFAKRERARLRGQLPKESSTPNAAEAETEKAAETSAKSNERTPLGHALRTAFNPLYVGNQIRKNMAGSNWKWPATIAGGAVGAVPSTVVYGGLKKLGKGVIDAYFKTPAGVDSGMLTPYTGYYSDEGMDEFNFNDEPTGSLKALGGNINRSNDSGKKNLFYEGGRPHVYRYSVTPSSMPRTESNFKMLPWIYDDYKTPWLDLDASNNLYGIIGTLDGTLYDLYGDQIMGDFPAPYADYQAYYNATSGSGATDNGSKYASTVGDSSSPASSGVVSSGSTATRGASSSRSGSIPFDRSIDGNAFEAREFYQNFLKYMLGNRDSEDSARWRQRIQDEIKRSGSSYVLKDFDDWYRLATDKNVGPVHRATEKIAQEYIDSLAGSASGNAGNGTLSYSAARIPQAPNLTLPFSGVPDKLSLPLTGPLYDINTNTGYQVEGASLGLPEFSLRNPFATTGVDPKDPLGRNMARTETEVDGVAIGHPDPFAVNSSATTGGNDVTYTGPEINPATVVGDTEKNTGSGLLPTWPRYAGAIGSGLLGLYNAFQEPDRYRAPRINLQLPEGRINLQNQVYNPIDQNMIANAQIAQGNATNRALRNSGLGASTASAVLAADNNTTGNLGTGFLQTWDANNQRRNAVIAANNQAEAQRANFDYTVDSARKQILNNAAVRNAQNDFLAQRLNYQAEGDKYTAISNQISNGLKALSGIGQENFAMNQINTNPAFLGYGVGAHGGMYYNPNTGRYERIEPIRPATAEPVSSRPPVLMSYPRDYRLELLSNPTLYPGYEMTLNGLKKKNR